MKPVTIGVIVGNRGFFPDHLVTEAREEITAFFKKKNVEAVMVTPEDTKLGGVETLEDAQKCGRLFKENKDSIDGVLVTLPNFGDERAVANTMRFSELDVPILIHAYADNVKKMDIKNRRDSFCGKISVCNNLSQYNIPFTLTTLHTVPPSDPSFEKDFDSFIQTCRVVRGLKRVRIGAVGARTAPFNTVRYSEKILEAMGISVETLDLSEVFGRAGRLKDTDSAVAAKIDRLKNYVSTEGVPDTALIKQAKLGIVLDEFIAANDLQALSIQCWTSLQEFYGVVPCSIMSMGSDSLIPNACEVDVLGALSMYALQLASGEASALVDWNNNYREDPDKAVIFHCSNLPKSIMRDVKMDYQAIIAGAVGRDNTYGTIVGLIKASPMTFLRASTDDQLGSLRAYIGEGATTDDPVDSFGGYGVLHVEEMQRLLRFMCENGFEHHTAVNPVHTADGIYEALTKYLGWEVYYHNGEF